MQTIDQDAGLIVSNDHAIVPLSEVETFLATRPPVGTANELRDRLAALCEYYRGKIAVYNEVYEGQLRTERYIGEELKKLPRSTGGRPSGNSSHDETSFEREIEKLDITKPNAYRLQQLANVDQSVFERYIKTQKQAMERIVKADLLTDPKITNELRNSAKRTIAMGHPAGVYNVIYADPPWEYDNTGVHGAADHHYPTMPLEDISKLLDDQCIRIADNAVLFLWATNPFLQDAFYVINAWGFEYKTNIVWVKTDLVKPGSGFYVRGRHELLLICTRGSFTPLDPNIAPPIGSVVIAPVQDHSNKPDEFYDIIERLYTGCNYIELFARQRRDGWEGWGHDSNGQHTACGVWHTD